MTRRRRSIPILALAFFAYASGSVARAQTPPPTPASAPGDVVPSTPAPAATPASGTTPDNSAAPAKPSELDFNLFGDEKKKSPLDEAREQEKLRRLQRDVEIRRKLLVAHQVLGFVTLGTLIATDIVGQLNYNDKYASSGTDTGKFYSAHEGLGISVATLFGATGICALAAPNPYPKPIKFDAALVHKVSMAVAAAGMVLQIVLGPITATRDGKLDQRDFALTHVITGWTTLGFMGAGTLAYVF